MKYIIYHLVNKQYFTGSGWGEINNAKKFDVEIFHRFHEEYLETGCCPRERFVRIEQDGKLTIME